jgi:hypothetical protein
MKYCRSTRLHGVTADKTAVIIDTAVKTPNMTFEYISVTCLSFIGNMRVGNDLGSIVRT